jgi:hypothetical protein
MQQCTHSSFLRVSLAMRQVLLMLLFIFASQTATFGQQAAAPDLAAQLKAQTAALPAEFQRELARRNPDIVLPPTEDNRAALQDAIKFVLRVRNKPVLYALALNSQRQKTADSASKDAVNKFKAEVDEARVDKQVGSDSSQSGSTSLTTKGSVPAILGFAVENGALESSTSGTSITFRGRPVQIIQALQKIGYNDSYKVIERNSSLGLLNRFAFGLTFDAGRTNSTTFTGNANQIAAFSVHVDLINHRDPRDKRYDDRWNTLRVGAAQEMANRLYVVADLLVSDTFTPIFNPWLEDTAVQAATAWIKNDGSLTQVLDTQLAKFPSPSGVPPSDDPSIAAFASATQTMLNARQDILSYVGTAPLVTFEYTDTRATPAVPPAVALPDTSNFKVIAEFTPIKGGSFTSNGSVTIFNSRPATVAANRVRDAQFSSQVDVPVATSVPKLGNVVLSFSGKYQFIPDDVLTTSAATGTGMALKGNIAIGQAKFTIPVKGSGVKIPLSLTVSNRTELIKETNVRGNIGITFDLDSIISRLKP